MSLIQGANRGAISMSNDFDFQTTLGQGNYGIVYKCIRVLDNVSYAIKVTRFNGLRASGD